jgi:gluconate 2-dehydrogenase gamma chain
MHMETRGESEPRGLSRRDLLRKAGLVGVAVAVPTVATSSRAAKLQEREALETFTTAEAEAVEAFVDRLIPSDANGAGASEARVGRYIDRALNGELAASRPAYSAGLAALDRYSRTRFGGAFADLAPAQQDAVLTDLERNLAPGFTPDSRTFFDLVREHTLQGMFGDPYHGGNADFIGWDLIGFPGVKLAFGSAEQQLDVNVMPAHKSTTDYPMFSGVRGRQHAH